MNRDLEKIVFDVKNGNNIAFYDLIKYATINKKYDLILEYIDPFIETENNKYKNDYNLYLLLLSRIIKMPDKYINYVRKLTVEDILIPVKEQKNENIIIENNARTLIMQQKLISASIELKKLTFIPREKNSIIRNLIHDAVEVQNNDKKKILELLYDKNYKGIVRYLRNNEKYRNLSKNDKYILLIAEEILKVVETGVIPEQSNLDTNRLFDAIDGRNYTLALILSEKYSKKNNISFKDNTIYLLLNDLCEIISKIEEELRCSSIDVKSIIYNLKNNKYNKAFSILEEYLIYNQKENYKFLIENLIKICIIEKDSSYEEPINILEEIINDNYIFDVSYYIFKYQSAINNNNDVAVLYLDIINKSSDLVKKTGVIEIDKDISNLNIINYNSKVEFIKEKLLEMDKGKNLLILENIDEESTEDIQTILREIQGITFFNIYDNDTKMLVIRKKLPLENTSLIVDEIIYKGYSSYRKKDYDKCIERYLNLFSLNEVSPFIYARIGLAYLGKGDKETAIEYLTVATLLGKNIDPSYDYSNIISDLKSGKMYVEHGQEKADIDKFYGIDNIEEIVNEIFQNGIPVEDVCFNLRLNEEEKNIVILLIARESYYQEKYELGDYYINKVSKVKNRSEKIDRLYKSILKNRKYYKNRDDSEHKKLVLYKKGMM